MLALAGIGELVTNDLALDGGPLGVVRDAAVLVGGDGRVAWVGERRALPDGHADRLVDLGGRAVVPGFVDSHTHLVFAGERTDEFAARMAGRRYEAGGIRVTVAATRAASDAQLEANARRLAREALASGTTTLEAKSGYGLTVDDEVRLLRISRTVTPETTYLGAHVVPEGTDPDAYVRLVCGEMLTACAPHARWIDVFCERGAFDADQSRAILAAGVRAGLGARIHANQLGSGPGIGVGVAADAASCDHCTHASDADIEALAGTRGRTVATLLPVADLSTRSPLPDARRMLDAGVTVALATNCNPGSSFTASVPLVIALAVGGMGMTCEEALWSATAGGAAALRRTDVGHLRVGASADLVVLDAPSHVHLAYRPGAPLVRAVVQQGRVVSGGLS